jgi:hypothetical protein
VFQAWHVHAGSVDGVMLPRSYGDLTPISDFSRIFTIIYIFIGLGVLVAFLSF